MAAREALETKLTLESAKRLCEYLDLPDTQEVDLPTEDPLRFSTVRLLGFLRNNWWKPSVANLANISPTAEKLLQRVREEEASRPAE
jgi:hypothetical protein